MYTIGVDSGTQGTKALLVEMASGLVLGRGYSRHQTVKGLQPGESEQSPETWIEAMKMSIKEALRNSSIDPADVVSLGISGQQHGLVALDKSLNPIRPAKLWNDTSTVKETEEIIAAAGGQRAFIEQSGLSLAVGYTASKILWLKKHEPENYSRLFCLLLPHNYLNFYLTGRLHMEYGDASGTGLMDIRSRQWQIDIINLIDPQLIDKLPPLSPPGEPVGYIRDEIAREFGFQRVLVSAGGGDNMMAAIGSGNVEEGICTLSLGTSGTIFSFSSKPFIDPEGEIAAFCDSTGGWLPLVCTMNVTNTTELFKGLTNVDNDGLEDLVKNGAPGAGRLIFLPYIDGERTPALPEATGVFFGLTRHNFNPACLARAVMEGTSLNLNYGFNRMKDLGLEPREIRATGGGAKSQSWLQIISTVFETPVITLAEPESAAFGAALQAIWCYYGENGQEVEIKELASRLVKAGHLAAQPDPDQFQLYRELYQRHNSLWKRLSPEFSLHRQWLNSTLSGAPDKKY
ncbi:MAG TPA: xylulokinase [Candidatus Saccharicenans sp.]|jgi:xylulokinase|nr:xylulokinase [Candidatus Saccharicenans sp.]HRD01245.1 xylulokinase [Candidatus Saccharicenans sp.]